MNLPVKLCLRESLNGCKLISLQFCKYIADGILSRNNSISGATFHKALRKGFLIPKRNRSKFFK